MEQILIEKISAAIANANYGEFLMYALLLWQIRGIRKEVHNIGLSLKAGELRFESIENEQKVMSFRIVALETLARDNSKRLQPKEG